MEIQLSPRTCVSHLSACSELSAFLLHGLVSFSEIVNGAASTSAYFWLVSSNSYVYIYIFFFK